MIAYNNCGSDTVSFGKESPSEAASFEPQDGETITKSFENTFESPVLDLVFVIDNSGSMDEDIDQLADRFVSLLNVLNQTNSNWQMCYIYTDVSSSPLREWYLGRQDRQEKVIGANTPNVEQIFRDTLERVKNDNSTGREVPIEAIYRLVENNNFENCIREDEGSIHFVILSDEDELSCGSEDQCQEYKKAPLKNLLSQKGVDDDIITSKDNFKV